MTPMPTTPTELNLTHTPFVAGDAGTARALIDAHYAAIAHRALPIWCITNSPSDLPGLFVARMHITRSSGSFVTTIAVTAPTLDAVREALPPGLVRIDRDPADEAHIVETWL